MSPWYYLRRLYSLDTLDMRLTTSSQTPRLAASRKVANGEKSRGQDAPGLEAGRPSKWNTLEYYVYYLVFITVVPMMFYVPYTASKGQSCHKYQNFLAATLCLIFRRVQSRLSQVRSAVVRRMDIGTQGRKFTDTLWRTWAKSFQLGQL